MKALQRNKVDFNILCVVSKSNVGKPRELYKFYKSLGVDNIQYIPLAEFGGANADMPFSVTVEEYGKFLVETFELLWRGRRKLRIRFLTTSLRVLPARSQAVAPCTRPATAMRWSNITATSSPAISSLKVAGSWAMLTSTPGQRLLDVTAATVLLKRKLLLILNARFANTSPSATAAAPNSDTVPMVSLKTSIIFANLTK